MSCSEATTFVAERVRHRARDECCLFGGNLFVSDLTARQANRRQLQAHQHLMTARQSRETRMQNFVLPAE